MRCREQSHLLFVPPCVYTRPAGREYGGWWARGMIFWRAESTADRWVQRVSRGTPEKSRFGSGDARRPGAGLERLGAAAAEGGLLASPASHSVQGRPSANPESTIPPRIPPWAQTPPPAPHPAPPRRSHVPFIRPHTFNRHHSTPLSLRSAPGAPWRGSRRPTSRSGGR